MLKLFAVIFTLASIQLLVADDDVEPPSHDVDFEYVQVDTSNTDNKVAASYGNRYYGNNNKIFAVTSFVKANWYAAQQLCGFQGLRLASIDNLYELESLRSHLSGRGFLRNYEEFWLAGTDQALHGTWTWFNNGRPLTYNNWVPGEPNNSGGQDHCLIMNSNGQWLDGNCRSLAFVVCESGCSNHTVNGAVKIITYN